MYANIFAAPPWNETWTRADVQAEYEQVKQKPGFAGIAKVVQDKLVGFAWGYDVLTQNTNRVDFLTISERLESNGIRANDTFYLADVGVLNEFRKQGIATQMLKALIPQKQFVCYRTKNPAMSAVFESAFGKTLCDFAEESAYVGGKVYVVRR
ncbi:MAG TPA: GNAT family N-acetyltransferase [Acidobacteriota bacterium]|nr:GNAT family N-acetyltransferase [Acidobacteriota bacterium]